MTTFADFIDTMPGMTAYARQLYLMIDAEAERAGQEIADSNPPVNELRALALVLKDKGHPWLAGMKSSLADALETDMRLAAIPGLRAWAASPEGIGNIWINWYVDFLQLHIKHKLQSVMRVAEQLAEDEMERV